MGCLRWWRPIVLAGLLASCDLTHVRAQGSEDFPALDAQVGKLYAVGKYDEAAALAERYVALARRQHGEQHREFAIAVFRLANIYAAQGRYAEAESLYKQTLTVTEKLLGPNHQEVAFRLNNLALVYTSQARYAEAESLYKRSLAIREKALGPEHVSVSTLLNNLVDLYRAQGRYTEAEPVAKRSLAIAEKVLGPDDVEVATRLNTLALVYQDEGRYLEAEPLFRRTVAIREKTQGMDHPDVSIALNNLASLYFNQGRYAEVEAPLRRSLAIAEKALGPGHLQVAVTLHNLADHYRVLGRYADAEPLFVRSLAIREKALGLNHPTVALSLNNLAELYRIQERHAAAEPLYRRSLAIREKALGPDHHLVGAAVNNLALLYAQQGRYAEAEPLHSRALSIVEKALGPEHPEVGGIVVNLASAVERQGRFAESEQLYKRALMIFDKALGPQHPTYGTTLNNLGLAFFSQGRYAEAELLFKRAHVIREKALGSDHFDVAVSLNNLAALAFARRDWANAAAFWRRSTSVLSRRAQRGTSDLGQALTGNRKNEAERSSWQFQALVKVAYRIAQEQRHDEPALLREMFQTAQWAQASEAATSLAQMAARQVKGDGALARLVRERQDLIAEWQWRDAARTAAIAQASDKRDRATEETNVRQLSIIDARVAEIDGGLTKDFPDYAAFASPAPMSVEEVQGALGASEALVLILDTPTMPPTSEETHIWVVTKNETRWVRTDAGTKALTDFVVALRCGLDYIGWSGPRCFELLRKAYTGTDFNAGRPLPFDLARAHGLYKALFGQVEKLIQGKQLLLVAAGPLSQLPPHVLVTEPSASGDLKSAAWLIRSHATTVLPAVSSLKALRRSVRSSAAPSPFIGFGNPLLDGPNSRYADSARRARETERCPDTRRQQSALFEPRRGVSPITMRGLANLASLKRQIPLPETADELCSVARDVGADIAEVRLGTHATEREIKALSASGALARYRIIHFATHAATAGQLAGTTQPGMIFTPPDQATEEDDGYLTASEVAALKLDADWVILSACNTAAGAATEAEALSGLARAFFYAQARALLVSHWEVNSEATVALITKTFAELKAEPSIGRAEALRRAMLNLIASDRALSAHPAHWAPFVVVGEGAAAR